MSEIFKAILLLIGIYCLFLFIIPAILMWLFEKLGTWKLYKKWLNVILNEDKI